MPGFLRVTFRSSLAPPKARSEGEPARKCRRRAASCGICFLAELEAWLPGGALQGSPGLPSRIRSLCFLWIAATQRDGVTLSGPVIVAFPRGHRRGAEFSPASLVDVGWDEIVPSQKPFFHPRKRMACWQPLNFRNCLAFPRAPGRSPRTACSPGVFLGI